MSDLEHARDLLAMASRDLPALKGMLQIQLENPAQEFFSDEIFGFHAQQAAEKILKARIASHGGFYAKTHDLMALLNILIDLGEDVTGLEELVDLNTFAVQYRYEAFGLEDDKLDRPSLLATVEALFKRMSNSLL